MRVQRPRLPADFLAAHYAECGVALARVGNVEYGTSATTIDLDVVEGMWRVGDGLALRARFGLASRLPVSAYMATSNSENSIGPGGDSTDLWVELEQRDGAETASLGAGTWARLDPTGLAADAGHLVTASLARRIGHVELAGQLAGGRLRRLAVSDYAPDGLAPVGTRMWTGRAELDARWKLAHRLELDGAAYVERSDRDDPRWLAAADGRLETHAGVDVTAHWGFHAR